jgi:hypothetical protein
MLFQAANMGRVQLEKEKAYEPNTLELFVRNN